MTGPNRDPSAADTREHLRRRTAEAARATARERRALEGRGPGEPGTLFVHPATADHGVEWLVLAREDAGAGRVLVVAADTYPLAGAADLELGGDHPGGQRTGGPLTLRCGFGLWLETGVLEAARVTGRLEPDTVARARVLTQRIEEEPAIGDPELGDPDLEDHYFEVLEPARRALAGAEASHRPTGRGELGGGLPGRKELWQGLAAVLLVGLVAAGVWGARLQGRIDRLLAPSLQMELDEQIFGASERGEAEIRELAPGASLLLLVSVDPAAGLPGMEEPLFRVELVSRSTGARWTSPARPPLDGHLLPVFLPDPLTWGGTRYLVRLHAVGPDGAGRLVEERELVLKVVASPGEGPEDGPAAEP